MHPVVICYKQAFVFGVDAFIGKLDSRRGESHKAKNLLFNFPISQL